MSVISKLQPRAPVLLVLMGLILISAGVLVWSVPLGLVAAGVGCFVLEWRISS